MILFDYPKDTENRYLIYNGVAFGPYGPKFDYTSEPIQFDSPIRAMTETPGIYRENSVIHDKISGNFRYHPLLSGGIPTPTANEPRSIKLPVWDQTQPTNAKLYVQVAMGLASSGFTSYRKGGDGTQYYHHAYSFDSVTKRWSFWQVLTKSKDPHSIISFIKTEFLSSRGKMSGNYYYVTYRVDYLYDNMYGQPTGLDWSQPQSYETVTGLPYRNTPVRSSTIEDYFPIYTARIDKIYTPKTMKDRINVLIPTLFPEKFPINDVHYGDLAQDALSKVQRNNVNMISFLKDLRHPTEMIPSLKNLRNLKKLKSYANSYLTVKYGLLPTISDLRSIVEAVKKHGPYFDSNGFSTYSAGRITSKNDYAMRYVLAQHIKVAIADEDSVLMDLIRRLDDIDILPTFENLWDLVPYSFVIDWFIDFGDFWERVDTRLRLSRLNIRYVTSSRKTEIYGYHQGSVQNPMVGFVDWVHYHRWVSDQCPVPPLSLQNNPKDFHHWVESAALIIQRL